MIAGYTGSRPLFAIQDRLLVWFGLCIHGDEILPRKEGTAEVRIQNMRAVSLWLNGGDRKAKQSEFQSLSLL